MGCIRVVKSKGKVSVGLGKGFCLVGKEFCSSWERLFDLGWGKLWAGLFVCLS